MTDAVQYPIRILQCVNDMHRAGLETMLMNYYRNIDRQVVQFDFLSHRPWDADYDDEIRSLGGEVFHAPRLYPQNYIAYFSFMNRFFREKPYAIVHSHIDSMSYFPLMAAKRSGVPVRIAHSHSTSVERDFKYLIKEFCRKNISRGANEYCACSVDAGRYLFGDKDSSRAKIVNNAIDVYRNRFNPETRISIREQLGFGDGQLVIGHVGRFSEVKNQIYIIELLERVLKRGIDAQVVFLGEGETVNRVRSAVDNKNLCDRVHFLGSLPNVSDYLQAMDCFVFPSLFEGVPLAPIEAQASGLPVLASSNVSREIKILESTEFLPLENIDVWVNKISSMQKDFDRFDAASRVVEAGFDISGEAKKLQNYYLGLYREAVSVK